MSIPLALERLHAAVEERGAQAYLLTVSDDGRPHAVHLPVRWQGAALAVRVGRRTAANVGARPSVSLLFPLRAADDYSLIVDGTAAAALHGDAGDRLVTPTSAVLHRPAVTPAPTASSCEADCVPLLSMRPRST